MSIKNQNICKKKMTPPLEILFLGGASCFDWWSIRFWPY